MLENELKNKINSLWEIFWTGGITNPLDVVEQMTYLMFIHDLDASDNQRAKESAMLGLPHKSIFDGEVTIGERTIPGNQLKWSVFHDFPAAQMYSVMQEWVFPFIKGLHSDKDSAYAKYMGDAIFKIPTPLMLDKIVTAMDGIYEESRQVQNADVRGDIYEYLLSKLSTAGVNGQFRTPRHIIRMMVEMMAPQPDEIICDPACGTSGFLVEAGAYLKAEHKAEIFYDRAKKDHYMNHMFHGYDMDRTMLRIGAMNMMTHGVENPFIEYRDSFSDQNSDREKYTLILANPPFKGSLDYDTVSADLLKICKTKKTELFKRAEVQDNDIPGILQRFKSREQEKERKRTEQSFMVDKKEIVENEYDLSINKYKEIEYVPVEYPPTEEIMADIYQPEKEIKKNLDELSEMLKKNNKFVSAIQNSLEKTQQLFNNLMQKYFG